MGEGISINFGNSINFLTKAWEAPTHTYLKAEAAAAGDLPKASAD